MESVERVAACDAALRELLEVFSVDELPDLVGQLRDRESEVAAG